MNDNLLFITSMHCSFFFSLKMLKLVNVGWILTRSQIRILALQGN